MVIINCLLNLNVEEFEIFLSIKNKTSVLNLLLTEGGPKILIMSFLLVLLSISFFSFNSLTDSLTGLRCRSAQNWLQNAGKMVAYAYARNAEDRALVIRALATVLHFFAYVYRPQSLKTATYAGPGGFHTSV